MATKAEWKKTGYAARPKWTMTIAPTFKIYKVAAGYELTDDTVHVHTFTTLREAKEYAEDCFYQSVRKW